MKILITGFDPFGGEKVNPSFEAVKLIPDTLSQHEIIKLELPTVFNLSIQSLIKKIEEVKPDIVICVGQAGGRSDISIECIGINKNLGRIPDNQGFQPIGEKIREDGNDGYFSNLPIYLMTQKIGEAGIPSSVSYTAGTYVCNHILYGLMHYIKSNDLSIRGGFIHVPLLPEQAVNKRNMPHMSLEMISEGLKIAILTAIENETDKIVSKQGNLN